MMLLFKNILAILTCFTFFFVSAQEQLELYDNPYLDKSRIYDVGQIGDVVDPFSGTLKVVQTDLSIPGNGGLDLEIVRLYSSRQDYREKLSSSKIGLDWRLHFGRVFLGSSSGCSPESVIYFESQTGELDQFAYNSSERAYLSKNRWKITCIAGEYWVYSPSGTQYKANLTNDNNNFYVSKITDTNNNYIEITGDLGGGLYQNYNIKRVKTSDGRSLTFYYENEGEVSQRLKEIHDDIGNRSWYYEYTVISGYKGNPYAHLSKVKRPDNLTWIFKYNSGNVSSGKFSIEKIYSPYGAIATFTYDNKGFKRGVQDLNTVISKKVLSGRKLPTSTTNYSYAYSGSYDQTTIKEINSGKKIVYKHYGYSSTRDGAAWKIGLPFEINVYFGSSIIERTTFDYEKIKLSNRDYLVRYVDGSERKDSDTYAAVVYKQTIKRDGSDYTTRYNYSSSDILLNPYSIEEQGPNSSRKINYSYDINKSKWLINNISKESMSGIGDIRRVFDSNGNIQSESLYGAKTRYEYYSSGDVSKMTEPNGNIHRYSNYRYGIPERTDLPKSITIRKTVNNYGSVASETDGRGYKTYYEYDKLNRLTKIDPPLGNTVYIDYTPYWVTTTRGNVKLTEDIDALGRVIESAKLGSGVTTQTIKYEFDSLGRQVYRSLVNESNKIMTGYDTLNRLLVQL